jgi:hypothetical protein
MSEAERARVVILIAGLFFLPWGNKEFLLLRSGWRWATIIS